MISYCKQLFFIGLFSLASGEIFAKEALDNAEVNRQGRWHAGAELYHAGEFDGAYQFYYKLLESEGASAGLFINMGHSLYKKGEYGGAIASYLQALQYAPRNTQILNDIGLISETLGYDLEFEGRQLDFLSKFTMYRILNEVELLYLFGTFLLTTGVLMSILFWFPHMQSLRTFFVLSVFFSIYWGGCLWSASHIWPSWGAVQAQQAVVYSAPSEHSGVAMFSLKKAVPVEVKEQRKNWLKVRLPDGKNGWIKLGDLAYYPVNRNHLTSVSLSQP